MKNNGYWKLGYKVGKEEVEKNIKLARQCMNFKLLRCDNKDCKNKACPLNKYWENKP